MVVLELPSWHTVHLCDASRAYDFPIEWCKDGDCLLFSRCRVTAAFVNLRKLQMPEAKETSVTTTHRVRIVNARWLEAPYDIIATVRSEEEGGRKTNGIYEIRAIGSREESVKPILTNEAPGDWGVLRVLPSDIGYSIVAENVERSGDSMKTTFWRAGKASGGPMLLAALGQCFGAEVSPDGTCLSVIASASTHGGGRVLHLFPIEPGSAAGAISRRVGATFLSWDPSSCKLILWEHSRVGGYGAQQRLQPGSLLLYDTVKRHVTAIPGGPWFPDCAAWMPNGRQVLVGAEDALWIVDVESGRRREVWRVPAEFKGDSITAGVGGAAGGEFTS